MTTAINWNAIEDVVDKSTWEKLTEQFWLDTRIPISNDLDDWRKLSEKERDLIAKVFGGLTLLDTIQSENGVSELKKDVRTPHEEAVLNNVEFMEAVHAKSYSSIFSTLNTKSEIEEIFEWTNSNPHLQKKAQLVNDVYKNGTPLQKKIASVLLESFLFYSGFYAPLWYLGNNKLPNVAEIIKLIIRDECISGDTELLTTTGWKKASEIRSSDRVLQYHADTDTTSFANPTTISNHYAPVTYSYSNEQNHVNLVVTPNHRMLFEQRSSGWAKVVKLASEKTSLATKRIINTAPLEGEGYELTPQERLMIAISADGAYDKSKNQQGDYRRSGIKTGTVPARVTIGKERKITRLKDLLAQAKWEYNETPVSRGRTLFTIQVPVEYVDREKKLSTIIKIEQLNAETARELIEEIAEWDGHRADEHRITWGSVDPDNAAIVQAVATLAGYRTHYRVIPDERSDTFSDYHRVQINKHKRHTEGQALTKTETGSQQMYGIEVPSGYIVVRRNGAVSVTGNSVHGTYIGYKFQLAFNELSEDEQTELRDYAYDLLYELYENELEYTHELYDEIGWFDDVKLFLEYNANKALMNLGLDPLFATTATDVNPIVMNGISTGTANHDFFSQVGNGYLLGQVEAMNDDDYTIGL